MPIEAKPLFRPDALGPVLRSFNVPSEIAAKRDIIHKWAALLSPDQPKSFREQELLPDFITDIFCNLLGYERPADNPMRYTRSREKYIEVNGKYADAVLGEFGHDVADKPIVALECKGPDDPIQWHQATDTLLALGNPIHPNVKYAVYERIIGRVSPA